MPHCFAMLIPHLSNSDRCLRSWGAFCQAVVEKPANLKTNGTFVHAKTGKEETVVVSKVTELTLEDARKAMRDAKERRMKGYEREGKGMPKPAL